MSMKDPPRKSAAKSSGTPLYRKLADDLRRAIAAGTYPVGSLLPTEQELCDRFATSRYTVREALRLLTQDGLVDRRQGRGTEVTSDQPRPMYAQSLSSLSQLYAYAEDTVLKIERVMTVVPDEAMALQLGRAPGRQWLLAEGVRRTQDRKTICVAQIFINTDFAELAADLKSITGAIHAAISDRFGVETQQVQQRISLDRADGTVAAQLDMQPGDWSVLVRRRYLAEDDRPILISLNWHKAEDFTYSQIIRKD